MSRPGPSPLLTALAANSRLAGECLVIEARDGTRACFTSLDEPQTIDLDLGAGDEICSESMVLSAVTLACGLDASFFEVQGALGGAIERAAVLGGKWQDASAWLVRISPGVSGVIPIMAGKVRDARAPGSRFIFEVRNQADQLNQTIGRTVTPYCPKKFGSVECGGTPVELSATVTGVTDALRLTVGFTGTFAHDYFNFGRIIFTSGALDGVISENIFDWISGGANAGSLVLWLPLPSLPEVGDTLTIEQGCGHIRSDCMARQGDALNFGGEPDVPGTDQILRYPNSAAG